MTGGVRARLPLIAALACVLVWSTTYAVSVAVLHHASPAVLSVVRFGVAGIALLPFAVRRPGFLRSLTDAERKLREIPA